MNEAINEHAPIRRMGFDAGGATAAKDLAHRSAAHGVRMARVEFDMDDLRPEADGRTPARAAVDALCGRDIQIVGVIGGRLTVAPAGAGCLSDASRPALARAWAEELAANASRLASELAGKVTAWEILPEPNTSPGRTGSATLDGAVMPEPVSEEGDAESNNGDGRTEDAAERHRIDPSLWAGILSVVGRAIREADPQALILSGGLAVEPVPGHAEHVIRYLERARAGTAGGEDFAPDGCAFRLRMRVPDQHVAAESASDMDSNDVPALLGRLRDAAGLTFGQAAAAQCWITGLAADDGALWNLLEQLASMPSVAAVLLDRTTEGPEGFSLDRVAAYTKRVASASGSVGTVLRNAGQSTSTGSTENEDPHDLEAIGATPDREADEHRPLVSARVTVRVPSAEELLAAAGLTGEALAEGLAAMRQRFGSLDRLPPGEHELELASPAAPTLTNQRVLDAMHEVGGGTWALLARAGLDLTDMVSARGHRYEGPDLRHLPGLDEGQRRALLDELGLDA